jgi:hypothetical protein
MYTNSPVLGRVLKKDFNSSLNQSTSLLMATGYIGESYLREIKPKLVKIAKSGVCKLLIGMVFHEGVSAKQKQLLLLLHKELRQANKDSGVYISRKEYHGKIYLFDYGSSQVGYLGSSNLSDYGFHRRLECTIKISDNKTLTEISDYLNFLYSSDTTNSLDNVDLKTKNRQSGEVQPSTLLKDYKISATEFAKYSKPISSQEIVLRVDEQPNSSLNLYFDKGRKNKHNLYSPRPWFEVELTTSSADRKNQNYPISTSNSETSKSRLGSFNAIISENGQYFKIQMKVHSDGGKNISSARESGGRETLGRYIKGRLQSAGVLRQGERITSDVLDDYGRNYILLSKIDDKNYLLEF